MFIFYLRGVGLPCHLIFCEFCLCEEVQCVYLRRHLGSPTRSGLEVLNTLAHLYDRAVWKPVMWKEQDHAFIHC